VHPEPIIITIPMLRHLVMCSRRLWLDRYGDPAERDSPADRLPDVEAIYALREGQLQRIDITSWTQSISTTQELIRQRADTIINACLETTLPLDLSDRRYTLRGAIDQLQRVRDPDTDVYSLIVLKPQGQPDEADWLQLDLCAWLLQEHQGSIPFAELWLGASPDRPPRQRFPHAYDENRLMNALTLAAEILSMAFAPPPQLLPHCKACHWNSSCQIAARRMGSLDLLYGVSRRTRQDMQAEGLTALADVAASSVEALQRVKGIGPATAPSIRANAQAWLENRPIWYNPMPQMSDDDPHDAWMFDLETLETNGETIPWSLGWCDTHGETGIILVAPVREPEQLALPDGRIVTLVPDSDTAWLAFAEAMSGSSAPIYHWTGYDAGILRSTAPAAVRNRLEPRMRDLHRLFTRSISLPLKSTSIKAVSVYLGFPWIGTTNWFEAFQDYARWLETGDPAALIRTCTYQGADVQSMAWVWRWLIANPQ